MKKLWNRTRSRSRRQSEARSDTIKPTPSKEQMTIPPVPTLPKSSYSTQRTTGAESDGRVRGVSRPGEFVSRPGTAGSLQHAVSRAADMSSQEFAKGHTRTKSPRYVDIFAVSKTPSIASAFNEEVAARNLDTKVTRTVQQPDYVPTSKYQEEVAVRNSYRRSSEAPRSSADRNHRSWISSGTESGPSRGHTPHHSWSKTISDSPNDLPFTSGPKATTAPHPYPSVSDAPGTVDVRLAGYSLSRSEVSQPRQAEYQPPRSSSRMSATSSQIPVITLAHRTIMDLTASDDEDSQPQSQPSQPPKADAQPSVPEQLATRQLPPQEQQQQPPDTSGRNQPDALNPPVATVLQQAEYNPVQVVSQMEPLQTPETAPKQQSISFSTISTLASLPPASQPAAQASSKAQLTSRRDHVAGQLAVPASNRLSTVNETESDGENGPGEISMPTSPEPVVKDSTPATNHEPAVPSNDVPSTTAAQGRPQANLKDIYSSPESLQSSDFTHPSNAFGVRTRDFALSPSKSSPRVEREANTKAKVSKVGSGSSEPDAPVSMTNGVGSNATAELFDEDAFKKKQDQARAALVRLQQSLNEDFSPPAREQAPARPNRMNGVGQRRVLAARTSSDPNGPVAPSSVFAQTRDHYPSGVDGYDETSTPSIHTQAPRPTLHAQPSSSSSTTARPSGRSASSRPPLQQSQSNIQMRARSADKKGKGKEREIDVALFALQRTAEEITGGPPRAASAHGRYVHSPVPSDRRAGSVAGAYDRGAFDRAANGFAPGYFDLKRPAPSKQHSHGPVPPSPGDVSLSNFPTAPQQHYQAQPSSPAPVVPSGPRGNGYQQRGDSVVEKDFASGVSLKRRGSATSQASRLTGASQYSIPFHMIPERGSSVRDAIVQEK